MPGHSLSLLSDQELLRDLAVLVARDRTTTAALLAHLAEVDARRLYLPAAYPSMYLYCVYELGLSEDSALKRIRAARTARRFPAIFAAVADGRLSLSVVVLLGPYLTPENVEQLLNAATHQTRSQVEKLLAQRFPGSEMMALIEHLPALLRPRGDEPLAPGPVASVTSRSQVAPVAPQRFLVQFTIGQDTHDKLRYAQELLSHQIPSGDLAAVLDRALDLLVAKLERGKFAATCKPRPSPRPTASARHVPAQVKRAVWERDGGQCTFVSPAGQRCPARSFLEFDHLDPVACGGRATAARMQLRCRSHNQYGAECTFGTAFMEHKRHEAQRAAEARAAREQRAAAAALDAGARVAAQQRAQEVIPFLRRLGFRADEARQAAAQCETIPDASLEERVRLALFHLRPPARCYAPAAQGARRDLPERGRVGSIRPGPQVGFDDRCPRGAPFQHRGISAVDLAPASGWKVRPQPFSPLPPTPSFSPTPFPPRVQV